MIATGKALGFTIPETLLATANDVIQWAAGIHRGAARASRDDRSWRAPWKGGAFQWVQVPPGNRSSRKQPEQSWR